MTPQKDTVTLHQEKSWWQQPPCEDRAGALLSRQAQSHRSEPWKEGEVSENWGRCFRCCMARNEVKEMRISFITGKLLVFKIKNPVDSVLSPHWLSHCVSIQNQEFLWWQSGETSTEPHTCGKVGSQGTHQLLLFRPMLQQFLTRKRRKCPVGCAKCPFVSNFVFWSSAYAQKAHLRFEGKIQLVVCNGNGTSLKLQVGFLLSESKTTPELWPCGKLSESRPSHQL